MVQYWANTSGKFHMVSNNNISKTPHKSSAFGRLRALQKVAAHDIIDGLSRWTLVKALTLETLRHRYRRTALGLIWSGLSFLMFLGIFVLVFGYLRGFTGEFLADYAMHVGFGWIAWGLLSAMVTSGATAFSNSANWIIGSNLPLSIYILKNLLENFFIACVCFVIMVIIAWVLGRAPSHLAFIVIPSAFICLFNAFWVALFLAVVASRFRDIQHLLLSFMRAFFFTTPIIWTYSEGAGLRSTLALLNPFTHFIEIVRKPMLGELPSLLNWTVVGSISIIAPVIAFSTFMLFRRKIVFWL